MTDGDGHQTQYVYDYMQNLLAVREYSSASGYNATAYTYDGVGNLLSVSGPDSNQVTTYTYNDLNQLVKTTYPDGTTEEESYNAMDNLLSSTDQEGRTTKYSYDFLNRLITVNNPDGTSTTYTYDKNGNELSVTNNVDTVKYSYDALNRMTSETDIINGASYTVSYIYDSTGNLQSITYPDGSVVTSSYDALGRTTRVASGSTTYAAFTYDTDGTIDSITYGNGEVTSYTYDSMMRPKTITTTLGSTQELGLSYSYDGAGNVVSINSETYGYDALNRLTSASGPWGTTTYSYDAAGNTAQEVNSSSSMTTKNTYNNMDELVRSTSSSGSTTTYSYDGDGDLVVKNDGTSVWTYVYNTEGEMTKVLENGAVVQQNYYDGNGRRVEQIAAGTTTLYLYTGLNVLYEKNMQTGATAKYVYADGMQVAAVTTSVLFFHQDELGSTRLVTGGSSPIFSSDYVPYGIQYGASGSQQFMYAGMLYDAATGLYYDNARYYDPATGRFTSADPTGGFQSDPQSLNGYAYARDNPLSFIDPTGLAWTIWDSIAAGLIIGVAILATIPSLGVSDALGAAALSALGLGASVGSEYAAPELGDVGVAVEGDSIEPELIQAEDSGGLGIGTGAGGAGARVTGDEGEVVSQDILADEGTQTERGLYMNRATGEISSASRGFRTLQMDLYDRVDQWLFDSKVGFRGMSDELIAEADRQVALVRAGFLNGVTWIFLPNSEGDVGISQSLFDELSWRGIQVRVIGP